MSFLDGCDPADTCLRGPQVRVVMLQFGLCQTFLGFSCSSLSLDDFLVSLWVVFVPHKITVDKVL